MTDIEEFEKWWCEHGIKFITEKTACFGAWQASQPEIESLKGRLHGYVEAFQREEKRADDAEREIDALKAEVERLRKELSVADIAQECLDADREEEEIWTTK